jgi:hypothetical protein
MKLLTRTLKITRILGKTLSQALFLLVLMLGISEVAVRQEKVQAFLPFPSLNSRHLHLERQWSRLERLAKSGVKIDCIALGNSMVLNGFDPQVFVQSYASHTDEELHCFNFGVDAMTPVSASALAEILIETYQPQILIFGTDARDFAIDRDAEETIIISEMAWIQYRLGSFSLEGWLVEHAYLYRYRYSIADTLMFALDRRIDSPENLYGFEPFETEFAVDVPPDPKDEEYHVQYYYRVLKNYTVQPENTDALQQLLAWQGNGTTIVVVEMPVPATYFYFFDNPTSDYNSFIDALRSTTTDHKVLLLETSSLDLIPDDGWVDYSHVNRKGSLLFSGWLGNQIGKATAEGKFSARNP